MTNDQLQQFADGLIQQYRHEIVRDGDWWHGTDESSFNNPSPNDDEWFHVNVYRFDPVKGKNSGKKKTGSRKKSKAPRA